MKRDIDLIADAFRELDPQHKVEQLKVLHPGADDDGLWFFTRVGSDLEIQFESSSGSFPFLVESRQHDHRVTVRSLDEAISVLRNEFGSTMPDS